VYVRTQETTGTGKVRAPKLAGRYIVTRMLGKGAQARVYLALDTRLKQWRAVKVLASNYLDDDHVRARFEAEAQVMAKLSHPNLMRVVDVDRDGRVPFMVMELARGGSVLDWCKRNGGSMPPAMALDVGMQCAEGLQHAHDQGVVHRDVKPHNILVREDGRVVLTDFGIAQIAEGEHLTATGAAMGTFVFMAPEQRSDAKSVDQRADVYGLGATLFTLLTLRTSAELFFAEARDELLEGIPDDIQPMILAACKYKREQRYATMKAFRDAMGLRLAKLDRRGERSLYEETVRLPPEAPTMVGRDANVEDLVSILGVGGVPTSSVVPLSATGKTDPPNERSFEEMPTVMPYRMPSRHGGTTGSSELPDYIDQKTLNPKGAATSVGAPMGTDPAPAAPAPAPAVVEVVAHEESGVNRAAMYVIGGCAILVLALLGFGLVTKTQASMNRADAGRDLVEDVAAYTSLADELGRSGADGDQLRRLYFGFQDARGTTQVGAAVAYVEAAVGEASRVTPSGIAATQVRQLDADLQDYRAAEERWKAARASRLGRLTGEIGLY
jgi:serine/threonine protein kinase